MQAAAMKVFIALLLLGVAGHCAMAQEADTPPHVATASALPVASAVGLAGEQEPAHGKQ